MKMSYPLSAVQVGIYAECVGHEGKPIYNLPYIYTLDPSLDPVRLVQAVETAVAAHPTLFTRLGVNDDGEPIQTVDTGETFKLTLEIVEDFEAIVPTLIEPFDLKGGRLFNIRLFSDKSHFHLFIDYHHIIMDATSMKLVLKDIDAAYRGEELQPEQITMGQLALDDQAARRSPQFEDDKRWYAENFDCSDVHSPLIPDLDGETHIEKNYLRVLAIDSDRVDSFCTENGIFRSTIFTAAHSLLMAKINNERQSLFTTVYNGRTDKSLLRTAGMMVKTLPVFGKWTPETTTLDFLRQLQDQMSGCRKHLVYNYSDLVEDLQIQPPTMFAWHGNIYDVITIDGKPVAPRNILNDTLSMSLYLKAFISDGRYHIKAEYRSGDYSDELIDQFLTSYEAAVEGLLTAQTVDQIDICTPGQLETLDTFNQTEVDYDATQTIVSLFRRQVETRPEAEAVVYADRRYTYAQVDELSDRIAAHIAAQGLGHEDVVSVLIGRSEWMVIASLGVLKAGCAYQPLDPSYPAERLNFMMEDASARLLIADAELRNIVDRYTGPVLLTGDIHSLPVAAPPAVEIVPEQLFILLYTSGTTGTPKGVQLTHANLVAFCNWARRHYALTAGCRVAAYASYGFDADMLDLYPTLTSGATVYIIAEEMRLDLLAINKYFEQNNITHSFMTTQVGYQFATTVENHSLRHLSVGGEKLATLTPPAGYDFHNIYGPTECTICVTEFTVNRRMKDIPIGRALDNVRLYVVDPQGRRLPVGAAGELWVAGTQVGRGYLNRPEKTAEVFIDNPFTDDPRYAHVYRTGDIVRYLPSGDIQFVGRRDGQVKIRGFRIELKEVEAVIREFPGITDATVQAFDAEGGGKFIAAYVVGPQPIDIEAMNAFILERKPPYMVPAVTMQIDAIPLNQNQKVNRRALPKPERKATEEQAPAAPMNVLETQLAELIASVVGNNDFNITTPLAYAGLTSITSIKLAVLLNKRFGVDLDTRSLAKTGTLQSIENEILARLLAGDNAPATETETGQSGQKQNTTAPLSYAQTGVYFECLKNPASTIYNIPYLLRFPDGLQAQALVEAVKKIVQTHPELHVHFTTDGDRIVQTTADAVPVEVPITHMSEAELETYKNDFVRPFNLQKPPLYRFEVVTTEVGTRLLLDLHHLIFDGGSADLFIRQLCGVLEGQNVEAERYTYLDFAVDQQQAESSPEFAQSKTFFDNALAACEGASEIPADLPKTDQTGVIGEAVCPVDHQAAAEFCRTRGITPAGLFLAATAYVTGRWVNNRDVYLCTVSNGRSNLRVADTVGMFVNTLALGINIGDTSVADFLAGVSETFDATLRHEDYPFARIAADYGFRPAIAYAYQVGVLSQYSLAGKPIEQELLELNVPKFKINIKIEQRGVVVEYDDALYSAALAMSMAESIAVAAERMMAAPEARVRSISIVSPAQAEQLEALRQVAFDNAPFRFMHESIAHFAATQPDREALVAVDTRLNYAQFNDLTDRIAAGLRSRGVRERDRVALLLPRTSRLILALFGTLKAGAAYIPCDPDYPADRVSLILEDSEARYIITTADRLGTLPAEKAIDVETLLECGQPYVAPDITPDDLAYIIYTSGSTGRPKGVMLRHEGICNYLYAHPANVLAHAVANDAQRVLSVTTISFDAALQDIGIAIFNGKTLIVATEEQANNPLQLAELIKNEQIDMVSGTPSRWQTWLTGDDFCSAIANVRICRAGGEKFSDSLLAQLRGITKARIFNCYGPTETTVACNNKELTSAAIVTVGRPQLGVVEYVADSDGNELPVGVVGELLIGGVGVARGYNNLDEMTRERFIDFNGKRVYRSGDYARWLPDGDVVILGRTDHQIKLRGLRIELGEIENVMLRVDGMEKVVIMIRKINDKEHLCAYYTASRPIAPEDLKAEISRSLTQYMVPTAYLQLDRMPVTPNGKTDVKALPEPQLAAAAAYVEPANDTERALCDIFGAILQLDRVGATDNFFDLGGTSLSVTQIIIEADKAGLHVAYGDVFANPTPRQLARLITGEDTAAAEDDASHFDYTAIDLLLKQNKLDTFRAGERGTLGNVLVTGATGFLGIHILRELIDSDAPNIYCLVRAKTAEKAENRLRTLLFYYFSDSFKTLFGTRLHVITGDVTQDLPEDLKVDTIFNCAAIVKHFSEGTEIEDVNIGGARRCAEYCIRTGARLVHISTASTRGLWIDEPRDDVFTEQRLYMGQYLGNKYIYSKYMAERLILDGVALHGLRAKIMRVGNLAARSTDGEFQANFATNSFMGRIRVYNMLGCCPHAMRNTRVEFSPINEVARAITLLATTPDKCTVFHPYNIHSQLLGDVLTGLTTVGEGIRFVEQEDFQNVLDEAGNDPAKAKQLSALLAYQDMAHGRRTTDVTRDNDYTTQVLYRLDFAWSPTSWDYVERMLAAIGGFGFFE